uniref:Thaumatin-like protein n=1 Tax=Zea mays TaxID=4577 RepID=B6SJL2_MAIZE|nr:thaumatin-like protein precursor [Zea mays]|eukprot:NP_001147009.1 thaumatin-like protein precursor [Zea mays]
MARAIVLAALLLAATASSTTATTLTIHNLCPHPVWPLVTPNSGLPSISDNTARLDPNALLTLSFPPTFWAGRVAARTGCDAAASGCWTGASPPATVVQVTVHDGTNQDQAAYSVSLSDGFNAPVVVSPQAAGGGQCPALGCPVDLNCDCPPQQRAAEGAACRGPPEYFKSRCPLTRTTPTDVEPVPQSCRAPGELKVVFCQATIVTGGVAAAAEAEAEAEMAIRTVVADS